MIPPLSRLRRALLVAGIALGAFVVAGLLAAWWFHDLPRRQVERALADRLEAEVGLGALKIDGIRRFVLRDLRVRKLAGQPLVESVEVETLVAGGGVRDILAGRFDFLELDGVVVRVARPGAPTREPSGPPARVEIARLILRRGRVVFAANGEETSLSVEGEGRGIGGDAAGALRAHADRVLLAPLASRDGHLTDVELRASLSARGASRVRLSTGEGTVRIGDRRIEVPPAMLQGSLRGDGEMISFEANLETPLADFASARGTWNPLDRTLTTLEARIGGARLSALAAFVPALSAGTAVEGSADAAVFLGDDGRLSWTFDLLRARVETPSSLGAELTGLHASGSIPAEDPTSGGPVRLEAGVERAWGSWNGIAVPAGLVPLSVSAEGTLDLGERALIRGSARARAPATGDLGVEGTVDLTAPSIAGRWRWSGATIPGVDALLRDATGRGLPADLTVHGRVDGEGSLDGPLSSPAVRGRVAVRGFQGSGEIEGIGRISLTDGKAGATFSMAAPGATVEIPSLSVAGEARLGRLEPFPLEIDGAGRWSPGPGGGDLDRLTARVGDLGRLEADGRFRTQETPRARGRVRVEGIDLARLQSFLRPWTGDPVPGFSVKGKAEATVDGFLAENGGWEANGTGAIRGSGFASEDGSRVLEGFDTSWDLDFRGTTAGEAQARGTAEVGGFVGLWETFFADYSGLPSSTEIRGSFRPARNGEPAAWGTSLEWNWPEGGTVRGALSSRTDGALGYVVSLAVADLGTSLDRYLRGPLGETVPWFERIEGSGEVDARVVGTVSGDKVTARGQVRLGGLRLAGTQGLVEVDGLDLDLPFDLAFHARAGGGSREITGGKEHGSLSFERLKLSGLEVEALRTGLTVEADSVALEEPLAVPMLGGGLGLERLRLTDGLRPSRRLVTAMLVHAIDLGEVARAFDLPPLEGTADGYFPNIELTGPTLKVDGGGGVDAFGGRIDIGDISGEDLLTRFPKLNLSLEFQGIDLERVTRVFDFGSMTGILDGHARDVELFRGIPTRFDARIESVDRGRERIDVKAINNIAILGTGGKVSAFDRGIHKFLDTFYYERLGITLQLVNDVFLMRGLERRGERELFLKGAFPFRIDIVNVKPGQTTSFRSMLDRMKAVDFKVGG